MFLGSSAYTSSDVVVGVRVHLAMWRSCVLRIYQFSDVVVSIVHLAMRCCIGAFLFPPHIPLLMWWLVSVFTSPCGALVSSAYTVSLM
jgi:hypothetical protein